MHVVNGSEVGRAQFETFLPNVTEFTLRLPDRSARYKFYLSAVTQVGSGEVFAKEMPRFANEGELFTTSFPQSCSSSSSRDSQIHRTAVDRCATMMVYGCVGGSRGGGVLGRTKTTFWMFYQCVLSLPYPSLILSSVGREQYQCYRFR